MSAFRKGQPIRLFILIAFLIKANCCYMIESSNNPSLLIQTDESNRIQAVSSKLLNNVEIENLPALSNRDDLTYDSSSYQQASCQLVPIIHLLKYTGCQSKAISSFACSGSCQSYVQLSTSKFWQHERSCSCCQQTGLQEATFTLDCPSLEPPYKRVKTYAPVDCMCRACTDLGREKIQPQELIEAQAGAVKDNLMN